MSDCLNGRQIERYVTDKGTADERAAIERHLATCEACRRKIEGARAATVNARDSDSQDSKPADAAAAPKTASMPGVSAFQRRGDEIAVALETMTDGYTVLGILPRGGQAIVYKAVQRATNRTVAVKVLLQGQQAPRHAQFRFKQEIELAASLRHHNIVTIFDSGIAQGQYYYAMEYIQGKPLDEYIEEHGLSLSEIMKLFGKVTSAVAYAHRRGVIHRDLKPANILVDDGGEPHVLDFGLAKVADGFEQTYERTVMASIAGQVMGTLAYMSPEQATADPEAIDVRTDVYSLGVILYQVLTERFPYPVGGPMFEVLGNIKSMEAVRPGRLVRGMSSEIEAIVMKTLAKEPQRRYQSGSELHNDIENWLAGRPILARSDSIFYVFGKLMLRNRYATAVVGLLVVIIAAFSASGFYMYGRSETARRAAVWQKGWLDVRLAETTDMAMQISFDFALRQWRQGGLDSDQQWGILRQDKRMQAALAFMADARVLAEKEPTLRVQLGDKNGWLADYLLGEYCLMQGDSKAAAEAFARSAQAVQTVRSGDATSKDWLVEYVAGRLAGRQGLGDAARE